MAVAGRQRRKVPLRRNRMGIRFSVAAKLLFAMFRVSAAVASSDIDAFNYYEKLFFTYAGDNGASPHPAAADHMAVLEDGESGELTIRMKAFGQEFHLALREDRNSDNILIEIHDGKDVKLMTGREMGGASYTGTARVVQGGVRFRHGTSYGFVANGIFEGYISLTNDSYYIENASKYCRSDCWYNAILYRASDVDDKRRISCLRNPSSCRSAADDALMHDRFPQFRSSGADYNYDPNRPRTCNIEMIADYTFYEFMNGNEGNVYFKIKEFVQRVNDIYVKTDFNRDGRRDNVGIFMEKLRIFKTWTDSEYPFEKDELNATKLLGRLKDSTRLEYCLTVAILHRDFSGGSIGLAYIGTICDSTYNVGIVQSYDHPDVIVMTTLAHEIGHNFGSLHDPENSKLCLPIGHRKGTYLMDPYTRGGATRPNNFRFSTCSKDFISPVIARRGSCFKPVEAPRCGNGRVDQHEECDCGPRKWCYWNDRCCTPEGGEGMDKECQVKRTNEHQCSAMQGPCCDQECRFIKGGTCFPRGDDNCKKVGTCNGSTAECIPGEDIPNGTPCLKTYLTCKNGKCSSNICEDNGKEVCECLKEGDDRCEVCCKAKENLCMPASKLGLVYVDGRKAYQLIGTPCRKGHFCNGEGACLYRDLLLQTERAIKVGIVPFMQQVQWLVGSWLYFFVVAIIAVIIVGIAVGFRYLKGHRIEAKEYAERLKRAKNRVDLHFPKFEEGRYKPHTYRNLCRLVALFPNLPIEKLEKVAEKHKDEHEAVLYILAKGHRISPGYGFLGSISRLRDSVTELVAGTELGQKN